MDAGDKQADMPVGACSGVEPRPPPAADTAARLARQTPCHGNAVNGVDGLLFICS